MNTKEHNRAFTNEAPQQITKHNYGYSHQNLLTRSLPFLSGSYNHDNATRGNTYETKGIENLYQGSANHGAERKKVTYSTLYRLCVSGLSLRDNFFAAFLA